MSSLPYLFGSDSTAFEPALNSVATGLDPDFQTETADPAIEFVSDAPVLKYDFPVYRPTNTESTSVSLAFQLALP